jgi:hypothetical protein
VGFLSLTWNEGVFALRLDFSFLRRKAVPRPAKAKKKVGPRPLPPPFALPPLRTLDHDLLDAPALEPAPSRPTPSVIVDASLQEEPAATVLMDEAEMTLTSPLRSRDTDVHEQRFEVRRALRGVSR